MRLPDAVEVEVERGHQGREQQSHEQVGRERVFHHAPYGGVLFAPVEPAHEGRETVGETEVEEQHEREDVVHQSGRGQFLRAVMTYHERVGKAENDGSQLSDDDGQAQRGQFPVVRLLFDCLHVGCKGTLFSSYKPPFVPSFCRFVACSGFFEARPPGWARPLSATGLYPRKGCWQMLTGCPFG